LRIYSSADHTTSLLAFTFECLFGLATWATPDCVVLAFQIFTASYIVYKICVSWAFSDPTGSSISIAWGSIDGSIFGRLFGRLFGWFLGGTGRTLDIDIIATKASLLALAFDRVMLLAAVRAALDWIVFALPQTPVAARVFRHIWCLWTRINPDWSRLLLSGISLLSKISLPATSTHHTESLSSSRDKITILAIIEPLIHHPSRQRAFSIIKVAASRITGNSSIEEER